MLLADAEALALRLMREFKLIDDSQRNYDPDWENWKFAFDNAQKRFGACHRRGFSRHIGDGKFEKHYPNGTITLSRELVLLNDAATVEDTIRHEIAHALLPYKKGDSHGAAWKAMCKRTGANPERLYDVDEVNVVKGDWSATCGACGRTYYKFRQPKRELWCAHPECKKLLLPYIPGMGRFHPQRKLTYRHKNAIVLQPSAADRRAAIDAMKARMRVEEETSSVVYQCAKCDRKSISFHATCPVCGGDMVEEKKLAAEKAELKKRIADLERKAGK